MEIIHFQSSYPVVLDFTLLLILVKFANEKINRIIRESAQIRPTTIRNPKPPIIREFSPRDLINNAAVEEFLHPLHLENSRPVHNLRQSVSRISSASRSHKYHFICSNEHPGVCGHVLGIEINLIASA